MFGDYKDISEQICENSFRGNSVGMSSFTEQILLSNLKGGNTSLHWFNIAISVTNPKSPSQIPDSQNPPRSFPQQSSPSESASNRRRGHLFADSNKHPYKEGEAS